MLPALLLLAAAQAEPGEDLIRLSLRYLARHQAADGSWGRRSPSCRCPDEPAGPPAPGDPAVRERALALAAGLDDEDPARRAQAQAALLRLGPSAADVLGELAGKGSPEVRARLADILRHSRVEGTAADVEITGWALLAFLGAGYSHLSKDVYDGHSFGAAVARGLAWLQARQDDRGALSAPGSAAHAMGAFALTEAYGLTGSARFKDAAQKAVDVASAHPGQDDRTLVWQVMALKSAELSGVTFPREAYNLRLAELRRRRARAADVAFLQAGEIVAHIFIHKNKEGIDPGGLAGIDPARADFETTYLASLALFQFDGPAGPHWKRFDAAKRTRLLPLQAAQAGTCVHGAWPAVGTAPRLKIAAQGALLFEIYCHYGVVNK
jgi:hypothetical protein